MLSSKGREGKGRGGERRGEGLCIGFERGKRGHKIKIPPPLLTSDCPQEHCQTELAPCRKASLQAGWPSCPSRGLPLEDPSKVQCIIHVSKGVGGRGRGKGEGEEGRGKGKREGGRGRGKGEGEEGRGKGKREGGRGRGKGEGEEGRGKGKREGGRGRGKGEGEEGRGKGKREGGRGRGKGEGERGEGEDLEAQWNSRKKVGITTYSCQVLSVDGAHKSTENT